MPDDMRATVYSALRTAQDKYAYFLLAAAGAAIALAVNQTHDAKLAWSQVPLAAAVLSWGMSFFFGCLALQYVSSTLYANAEFLNVREGIHPVAGTNSQMTMAAAEGIRNAMETNSNRGNRYSHWQFRALILGSVFFLIWHVLEMYLRVVAS